MSNMYLPHCCLFLLTVYTGHALYNCNRQGAVCRGTCNDDGRCDPCSPGHSGYDCSVVTDKINGGSCMEDVTCGPDSICWDDDGKVACLCPESKTGSDCKTSIVDLSCETGRMSLAINPREQAYPGILTVFGQSADPACVFKDPAKATNLLDTSCGGVETNGTVKSRKFIFKQHPGITTSVDLFILTKCGTGEVVVREILISELENIPEEDEIPTNGAVPVAADLSFQLLVNGAVIDGPVDYGDSLQIVADLTVYGKFRFAAVRFDDCVAKPTASDVGMTLIDNNCPGYLARLMTDITVDGTQNSFGLKPFKFEDSDIVIILCSINVCSIATDCDPNCNSRNQNTGPVKNRLVSQTYRIRDPVTTTQVQRTNACTRSTEMQATVVGLSTALCVVLLIC